MSRPLKSGEEGRSVRYALTVVAGFAVDFVTALALARLTGISLPAAALAGFTVAFAVNYVLFELWVFRAQETRFSAGRLVQTALAAGVAAGVRVGVIGLLERVLGGSIIEASLMLLTGALASLLVNYAMIRSIFAAKTSGVS